MNTSIGDEFDPRFGRIERAFQRAGWVVIALIMAATLAGLFGGGVVSDATARDEVGGNSVELTYPRFGREASNLELLLRVQAPGETAPRMTVVLSGEYVDKVSIVAITPQPASESVDGEALVYTWDVAGWSQPVVVRVAYEARDWREIGGRIDVGAGESMLGSVEFSQFVFP